MNSTTSAGITNQMFHGAYLTNITLPKLNTISCTNNSDSLTDEMFGNNQNLKSVTLPNLVNYQIGSTGGNLRMFYNSDNVETLSFGTVGANENSVLILNGFDSMNSYIFSNMSNLKTFNTSILQKIPGIATFKNDTNFCKTNHTLDWSNTKLSMITNGADKCFYKCEYLRKWILPSTIQTCPSTNSDTAFLFGSNIQIIDIRNRVDGTTWGDLFKGSVINNTDSSVTTPVKLLFLHFNPNTMPTFS